MNTLRTAIFFVQCLVLLKVCSGASMDRCNLGYSGERCHVFTLAVGKEEQGYSRTTALAVIAVVLSLMCVAIIAILLALRYHKKDDADVESEEKVKLESTSVQQ
ncbi:proheparin-binding EGF-like growth factor [Labeo rohita]|uniref:Proheparin-binding EGF-like growth factor n=1 Tax=Labeo rohita TaxID=84645 RepID=A0A498LIC1_LABRO|nr:proheparin-binding EGF-like growth factor [Labeo rohita]